VVVGGMGGDVGLGGGFISIAPPRSRVAVL